MPRKYIRKSGKQLDRTNLEAAFKHRITTNCSLKAAADQFGVKKTTLVDAFNRSKKLSDGVTYVPVQPHTNRVFTPQEECSIVDYTIQAAKMFYGLPMNKVRRMVYQYAIACESQTIPDAWKKDQMATRDWYYSFMERHPNTTQGPSTSQPATTTQGPSTSQPATQGPSTSQPATTQDPSTSPPALHATSMFYSSTPGPSTSTSANITPESVRPFPKAGVARPYAKGRKRVRACILTENEEAITDLRMKAEKRQKVEKKKAAAEWKALVGKKKGPQRRKSAPEDEESEEDVDDVQMRLDDSSEYSDEGEDTGFWTSSTYLYEVINLGKFP